MFVVADTTEVLVDVLVDVVVTVVVVISGARVVLDPDQRYARKWTGRPPTLVSTKIMVGTCVVAVTATVVAVLVVVERTVLVEVVVDVAATMAVWVTVLISASAYCLSSGQRVRSLRTSVHGGSARTVGNVDTRLEVRRGRHRVTLHYASAGAYGSGDSHESQYHLIRPTRR